MRKRAEGRVNIRGEAIPGDTASVPDDQGKVAEDKGVQNWESSTMRKNQRY